MPQNFNAIVGKLSREETKGLMAVLVSAMKIEDIVEVLKQELTDDNQAELGAQFEE